MYSDSLYRPPGTSPFQPWTVPVPQPFAPPIPSVIPNGGGCGGCCRPRPIQIVQPSLEEIRKIIREEITRALEEAPSE